MEYVDILHDKPHSESFEEKIKKVQYNVELLVTGAI